MKLCSVIILYNPDSKEVEKNISKFIEHVDYLILWDNTPADKRKAGVTVPGYEHKIVRMSTGKNEGLSYAFNRAAEFAWDHGCSHLLTMDQDSEFEDFENYKAFVKATPQNHIFTPNMDERGDSVKEEYSEVYGFLNSGAIYPLDILRQIGPFNEDFLVDMIDTEYGMRAHTKNIQIIKYNGCRLKHQLGYYRLIRGKYNNGYSPARLYDISRNVIKMVRYVGDWPTFKVCYHLYKGMILGRVYQIVSYEDNKIEKLGAILRGTCSGLFSRLKKDSSRTWLSGGGNYLINSCLSIRNFAAATYADFTSGLAYCRQVA